MAQLLYSFTVSLHVSCFSQGGSASGPGLTAFVLISLLENKDLKGVSILNYCLHDFIALQ